MHHGSQTTAQVRRREWTNQQDIMQLTPTLANIPPSSKHPIFTHILYFLDQTLRLLFFAAHLSTGGWRIFLWKPADINDGWSRISYVRAIQRQLLDAVSSLAQPLSPAVSRGNELYNTNCTSDSLVTIVRNYLCMCACALLVAVATIQGRRLFHSELPIVRLLFEGGVYSKKYGNSPCYIRTWAAIQGWCLFHSELPTVRGWRLFEEIHYL